ncbi:MAG: hypothetical protein H6625_09235 [Bdellovibrionaceae bacterium]|nr:hypothetical protein [Pseudobdellovibrionaceae bacterium]
MKIQVTKIPWIIQLLSFFILLNSNFVLASNKSNFDLVEEGNSVCKYKRIMGKIFKSSQCYPLVVDVANRIEVVDKANLFLKSLANKKRRLSIEELEELGGITLLGKKELEGVINNFYRISIHNFSISQENTLVENENTYLPFYVSVYWQSKMGFEGTIHIDGKFVISNNEKSYPVKDGISKSNHKLPITAEFTEYSDSSSEQNENFLRFLESTARKIHYSVINGIDTDINKDTVAFLNNVIGPILIGELFEK